MKPWQMAKRFGAGGGGGGGDPHFAKVALLLHFEGANNSTTFTDSSSHARAATVVGAAKLSTTSPLTGSASGVFPSNSDYLTFAGISADGIGTGAFCIEVDVRLASSPSYSPLMGCGAFAVGYYEWTMFMGSTTELIFYYGLRGVNQAHIAFQLPVTISTGTKYKCCVRRDSSGNWAAYLDGVKCATYRFSPTNGAISFGPVTSGELNNPVGLVGGSDIVWVAAHPEHTLNATLDELRFTVGESRYTGSYTPESGAFPDS